ncbi:Polysaccharide pyruvyl transferase [Lachnospiraceae bacterium]|nr:Polysaccharide pyruvyl transferase [Lachnospiraceae bacterium]
MKKKIGIVTLVDLNLGNRLQNYALQEYLTDKGYDVETIGWKKYSRIKVIVKTLIKNVYLKINRKKKSYNYTWEIFDLNIKWSPAVIPYEAERVSDDVRDRYDYFMVGSDQVWNPNFYYYVPRALLKYARDEQKVSYAASFGVSEIPEKYRDEFKAWLSKFKTLSVREEAGADIIKDLTGRDAAVLLDPTMLISRSKWVKASSKSKVKVKGKFVVKYFLGEKSKEYDEFINMKAAELGAVVIDILNCEEAWKIGPAEFLYLFLNAEAAFVDSFHGTVFSILFHKPFAVFDRIGTDGTGNMNSRIDTLLKTFGLNDHRITNTSGDIEFSFDTDKTESILRKKRKEASEYIDAALEG